MNGNPAPPSGGWPSSGAAAKSPVRPTGAASECGVIHDGCISTWKGTCDRESHHDGSHHCSSCNMLF